MTHHQDCVTDDCVGECLTHFPAEAVEDEHDPIIDHSLNDVPHGTLTEEMLQKGFSIIKEQEINFIPPSLYVEPYEVPSCGKCKRPKVNGKCPACGRPTLYTPEFEDSLDQKVEDYLKSRQDDIQMSPKGERLVTVNLPTIEDFALTLDISDATVSTWRNEHPKFLRALEKIKKEQQKRLLDRGLEGTYNPTIAKLILSANHGMAEKSEQDITSRGKEIKGVNIAFVTNGNQSTITPEGTTTLPTEAV